LWQYVSIFRLRRCLFSHYSILADTFSLKDQAKIYFKILLVLNCTTKDIMVQLFFHKIFQIYSCKAVSMEFWRKKNFGIKHANFGLLKRELEGTLGKTLKEAEKDGYTQT